MTNIFRDILKDLPKGNIEIISDDPKEKEAAKQMSAVIKMLLEEIPEGQRYPYIKECPCCGLKQKILTKKDDSPEYYAEIYLQCQCGEYIDFDLPVN